MHYILNENYALRGWKKLPLCLTKLQEPSSEPEPLRMEEFFLLSDCDGKTELKETPLLQKFLEKGIIKPGEGPLQPEQEYRCFSFVRRPEVRISITNRCNARCRHCYAADAEGHLASEISLEIFCSLIRQMAEMDMRTIEITGGEPLLHPQLEAFVRCIAEHDIRLSRLYTNGFALTDDVLDMLERYGQKPMVQVSFDGFGMHDWMRGVEGAEQKAIDAMDLLRRRGFPMQIGMNINGRTAPAIPESFLRLSRAYHPSFWIYYTTPSPRWLASASTKDYLSIPDYFALCQQLCVTNVLEKLNCHLHMFMYPNSGTFEEFSEFRQNLTHSGTADGTMNLLHCSALQQIHIANDGRVLPCSGFEGVSTEEGFLTGDDINIKKRPLMEILSTSSYHLPFQTTIDDLLSAEASCRACKWLPLCRGGCRLLSLDKIRTAPTYDRKSEFQCLFYKGGFAERYVSAMEQAYQSVSV